MDYLMEYRFSDMVTDLQDKLKTAEMQRDIARKFAEMRHQKLEAERLHRQMWEDEAREMAHQRNCWKVRALHGADLLLRASFHGFDSVARQARHHYLVIHGHSK